MRTPKRVVTGHNREGKGIIETVDEGFWTPIEGAGCDYNVMWATQQFPHDLNKDWSKQEKEKTVMSLSLPNGTVLRLVDRAPGTYSAMHRTQSLDYGIVVEGEIEMIMDSGERISLYPGDICIQRGTMHQWHNPTQKYARIMFVLMDAHPIEGMPGDPLVAQSCSIRLIPCTVAGNVYKGESGYEHVKGIGSRL